MPGAHSRRLTLPEPPVTNPCSLKCCGMVDAFTPPPVRQHVFRSQTRSESTRRPVMLRDRCSRAASLRSACARRADGMRCRAADLAWRSLAGYPRSSPSQRTPARVAYSQLNGRVVEDDRRCSESVQVRGVSCSAKRPNLRPEVINHLRRTISRTGLGKGPAGGHAVTGDTRLGPLSPGTARLLAQPHKRRSVRPVVPRAVPSLSGQDCCVHATSRASAAAEVGLVDEQADEPLNRGRLPRPCLTTQPARWPACEPEFRRSACSSWPPTRRGLSGSRSQWAS